MRLKIFLPFLGLVLIASAATVARAQDEEEAVRGSFLTTRVTSSSKSGTTSTSAAIAASANQAAGKTTTGKTGASKSTAKSSGKSTGRTKSSTGKTNVDVGVSAKNAGTSTTVKAGAGVESYSSSAIGIGYTLYMRDAEGNAIRVDPSREFRAGDRIRLSLESNTDGYLYIFHTENNGEPQMLYPDTRLEQGDNRIEAHVPYEIPWNEPGTENWFKFDANPANERLYIVVSRQPLPGIPTGTALVNYCGTNQCPWRPPTGVWAQVNASVQAKVGVVKSARYGQKQTQTEQVATTRGLGLDQSAPEPSVIRMNASSTAPILVTAVDLIHK